MTFMVFVPPDVSSLHSLIALRRDVIVSDDLNFLATVLYSGAHTGEREVRTWSNTLPGRARMSHKQSYTSV